MPNNDKLTVPAHLSEEGASFYRDIAERYILESQDEHLLVLACQALDRAKQARELLDREGIVLTGSRGGSRPHPAVRIEAVSRTQFLQLIRELNLSTTTASAATQPPPLRRVRPGLH